MSHVPSAKYRPVQCRRVFGALHLFRCFLFQARGLPRAAGCLPDPSLISPGCIRKIHPSHAGVFSHMVHFDKPYALATGCMNVHNASVPGPWRNGIRRGLKIPGRKACRFDPCRAHQQKNRHSSVFLFLVDDVVDVDFLRFDFSLLSAHEYWQRSIERFPEIKQRPCF